MAAARAKQGKGKAFDSPPEESRKGEKRGVVKVKRKVSSEKKRSESQKGRSWAI